MSTLQEVQTWLGTLSTGTTVSIGSSLFNSTMITSLYALIPSGDNPVSLDISAIDVSGATLTGTATFLGEAGTTVVFVFTQPDTTLLLQLNVTPPASLVWTLLSSYNVGFGNLAAQFVPNPDANVVNLVFSSNVTAGTSLSLPITLDVPTYSGDWLLEGNFTSVGNLAQDALTALAGNNDVIAMLQNYFNLADLSITEFEVAFNPGKATCSMIRIGLSYATNWTFFDDKFEVQSINFDVEVFNPFSSAMSFQGILYAEMEIPTTAGNFKFDVGGQFPDNAVFAQIADGSSLTMNEVFAFFQATPPSGFPNIEISVLSFYFWPGNGNFTFQLAITQPFPIIGNVNLNNFSFNIAVANTNTQFNVSGALSTSFSIGSTTLALSGSYATGQGLSMKGSMANLDIGDIITGIGSDFGVQIPSPIGNMVLDLMEISLSTGGTNDSFSFDLNGHTLIAGTKVGFSAKIDTTWGSTAFAGTFGGTIVLTTPSKEVITFGVTFSTSASDNWIEAYYTDSSDGLTFEALASVFGFDLPTIPSELDLDLTNASFYYNFTTQDLAFGLVSKTYGNATFVTTTLSSVRQYFFVLAANPTYSLSDLPLIGQELAKIENIVVDNIMVVIGSEPADAAAVSAYKNLVALLTPPKGTAYPQLPITSGDFVLSADLDFGDEVLPMMLSMGGTSSSTTATATALPAATGTGSGTSGSSSVSTSTSSDGTSWYTVQKTFGPLTIQRIGARYQSAQQILWFEIDASITVGPMTISMMGMGIGSSISSFSPVFSLQGMGIAFSQPPLTIAGSFVNLTPPSGDLEFDGSVMIGLEALQFQAFGFYGEQQNYTSMFIYGDVSASFGGLPAFFLTGIALGFGYNSGLVLPTINQVEQFPLIEVLPDAFPPNAFKPPTTPQDALSQLLNATPPWVTQTPGPIWIAAGITFTSFDIVNSQALVIFETGPDLTLSLIGTSRAQFPQGPAPTSPEVYAYIGLDLELIIKPDTGVFSLQAVLSNMSFLLDRSCVLTGGFAFFIWFGSNPYSGDFVLTLGGYNPGFTPPSYYPTVPRVGFHWSLDSSISIAGDAYFAFTPSALMVGGELNAVYQVGNLKAWFDAHADIIVQWKPFWFYASIGITVGASYKMDLLLTTCTVTIELGCGLEFWGPSTGGSVYVDWYIISFTIAFGADNTHNGSQLTWTDVQTMLPNAGSTSSPNILSIAPTAGLTPSSTQPTTTGGGTADVAEDATPANWIVRGSQFSFSTSSTVPATTATVGGSYTFNSGGTFNVAPLNWTNMSATHTVTIQTSGGADCSSSFTALQTQQNLPSSLWGTQSTSTPNGNSQLVPNQITGVTVQVNPPQIGSSAGPVNVELYLEGLSLSLPNAILSISNSAQPTGDIPLNSQTTVSTIANTAGNGIASTATITARNNIFTALGTVGYQPVTNNDTMMNFANDISGAFSAEPMMVN